MIFNFLNNTFQLLSHYFHYKVMLKGRRQCLHVVIDTALPEQQARVEISFDNIPADDISHVCIEARSDIPFTKPYPLMNLLQRCRILKELEYTSTLFSDNDFSNITILSQYAQSRNIRYKCLLEIGKNISIVDAPLSHNLGENVVSIYERLTNINIETIIKCRINPDNIYWADDFMALISRIPSAKWICTADFTESREAVVANYQREQTFHAALFFLNLSRRNDIAIEEKLLYKQLSFNFFPSLKKHNASYVRKYRNIKGILCRVPENDLFLLPPSGNNENIYYSPLGEILLNTGKAVKAKIQKKIPVNLYRNTTPASSSASSPHPAQWRHVLITGWYGTETTGDKAILGEVLHFIKTNAPDCKVTLTTILDIVSLQTNTELYHLENATIVPIETAHKPSIIESVDAVIMGGGPLMESSKMLNVWKIFKEAKRQSKARIIFGCGIGPIHSDWVRDATTSILQMTTAGFLRDKESFEYASRLYPQHHLKFACDPAFGFVKRHAISIPHSLDKHFIAALLRANTGEFYTNVGKQELGELNQQAANNLANIIEPVCNKNSILLKSLHMNAPWIGGDDRLFNRSIENAFSDKQWVYTERGYLSLDALISQLKPATIALAMRYHGHIFSAALGIPFLSIDYTGSKGKVQSLVQRLEYGQWSQKWEDMDTSQAVRKLEELLDEREKWSLHLINQTNQLVSDLYSTYEDVFETPMTPVFSSSSNSFSL